jgi:hypothetical protein
MRDPVALPHYAASQRRVTREEFVEAVDRPASMPPEKRWLLRRIGLWILKSSFQLHLSLGAMATAYSTTGCTIHRFFAPNPRVISQGAPRLTVDELKRAALLEYPKGRVVGVWDKLLSTGWVAEIWLEEEDGLLRRRLFDPYAGTDLGNAQPAGLRLLAFLRNAHVNLLAACLDAQGGPPPRRWRRRRTFGHELSLRLKLAK